MREGMRTDEQKLSCTFTLDVPGLGYLEGGTEADVRSSPSLASYTIMSTNCNRTRKKLGGEKG
jgi:hypothetical protein